MPVTSMTNAEQIAAPQTPGLRLFLDSADPADWERFLPLGVFHGVTTNPLLLQRADQACTLKNLETIANRVADHGAREIQMQVWGASPAEMFRSGSSLALMSGLGIDVVVKVPATEEGYQVARRLSAAGTRITMTAVYSPGQVLMAAGFGAAYAAPYLGRLIDARKPGRDIVLAMDDILKYTASGTRLLVASLRKADQVVDLAQHGLDTFTFGPDVAAELLDSKLTTKAAAQFQESARAMGGQD
jgi:transaldolase